MALKFLNDGYFAGKVGIGTASPGAKLHIAGGNLRVDSDGTAADYSEITDRKFQVTRKRSNSRNK